MIYDQPEDFLSKNKLLYRFQLSFQKKHSTNTCLGHLTDKIATGFEKGLFTGMILTDLQKAFDTVDHQIFLKKMKYIGFSKNFFTLNSLLHADDTCIVFQHKSGIEIKKQLIRDFSCLCD